MRIFGTHAAPAMAETDFAQTGVGNASVREPQPSLGVSRSQDRGRQWSTLLPILRCPACHKPLLKDAQDESVGCGEHAYPMRFGVPLLLMEPSLNLVRAWEPSETTLRDRVWRWVPGPVAGGRQLRLLRHFLASTVRAGAMVVNIGSGGWDLGGEVFNVDLYPFPNVDVAGDVHNLPFDDASVDAMVCMGTLEHIEAPEAAVTEFFRVLRSGGRIFCTVPFLQAYHEDPDDFQRWTRTGVDRLFRDFQQRVIRPSHGPGSAFTWIGAEVLATLLSFGRPRVQTLWLIFWRYVLAPFKWTDALTEGWAIEHRVSCGFSIVAEKP